jgi:hypothetical protein
MKRKRPEVKRRRKPRQEIQKDLELLEAANQYSDMVACVAAGCLVTILIIGALLISVFE